MPAARRVAGRAGRVAGVIVAACAAALWAAFLFRNPHAAAAEGRVLTHGSLMILASLLAATAAACGAHLGMYLLFFALFFPVGLNTLLGPGVFQAIGWLDLAYLGCAILVHRACASGNSSR